VEQDVMAAKPLTVLQRDHTPVALHACGDLHVRLMQLASAPGCQHMAIAPCCYNRISRSDHYQAMSTGQASGSLLQLSLEDLGTADERNRHRRRTRASSARHLHGPSFGLRPAATASCAASTNTCRRHHCPAPGWKNPSLLTAAIWLRSKSYPQSGNHDWPASKQPGGSGWPKFATSNCFAEPVPTPPGALAESGSRAFPRKQRSYVVRLGTFCDSQLTPRNLLLLAERKLTTSSVLPCG
jgi:hypothetical protein